MDISGDRGGDTRGPSTAGADDGAGDAAISGGLAGSNISVGFATACEACNSATASLLPKWLSASDFE